MPTARLVRHGKSQVAHLPERLELQGREVELRRAGDAVLLVPRVGGWAAVESALGQFTEDFLEERSQLPLGGPKPS